MQRPELIYYAALALIALPTLPFNRLSAVVIGAWLVGQFGYLAGLPVDWCDTIGYGIGGAVGVAVAAVMSCRSAWASALLFLPLTGIAVACATGSLHPYYGWWGSYYLAMAQVALLPFCTDWRTVREGLDAVRDRNFLDKLLRVSPWAS